MSEPVEWRDDGEPRSARFDDRYHSVSGAQAQARFVFLGGCGLPGSWAGRGQWRILETGFGLGLNFLTTWLAWRDDPARCGLLHFVSIEAYPVSADDLRRGVAADPQLAPLADALAGQWNGLLPGVHRLVFEGGRVLLTLCVGDVQPMLRTQRFDADSIYLDGFSPARNPEMWSADTLKAVARFARRGTGIATWTIARPVRDALGLHGFRVDRSPGLPPKRDCLRGRFVPAWEPRKPPLNADGPSVAAPSTCAVVGAGLAGAAVAASLARRGWQVTVIDAAEQPATGASGAPVAIWAPHVSPDDALLSRLTRAGVRATAQQLALLLEEGVDWSGTGVLERHLPDDRLPPAWAGSDHAQSRASDAGRLREAGLDGSTPAWLHACAGWARPARLVAAWLAQPGIRLVTGSKVNRLEALEGGWRLLGTDGDEICRVDRVVLAAGIGSRPLAARLPLQPVRGQLAWGTLDKAAQPLPTVALNGDGHLVTNIPSADGGAIWLTGATFDRDSEQLAPRTDDMHINRQRLQRLHPAAAATLDDEFVAGRAQAWVGIRCASGDRRPLVGPVDAAGLPGVWTCTALGSRGVSFAALCGELLAARWHGEPLPLTSKLAASLDTARVVQAQPAASAVPDAYP